MRQIELKYFHIRFSQRLPCKDDTDIDYVKSKYQLIVQRFIEEFFDNDVEVSTNEVLDKSFEQLKQLGIEVNDIEAFQVALSLAIVIVMKTAGCKLKVSRQFFVDQFINCFAMRVTSFTQYTIAHRELLVKSLRSTGAPNKDVVEIMESAMDWAEANVEYSFNEKSYIGGLVKAITSICEDRGYRLSKHALILDKLTA